VISTSCGLKKGKEKTDKPKTVSPEKMETVYNEIKTPYKYGLIMVPPNEYKKLDCPSVFRQDGKWYMTYIIYDGKAGHDGRGYETFLATSDDLLHWNSLGKVLSFTDTTDWDCNQKAGYISLQDYKWGGSYSLEKYDGKYWMSYFGGNSRGYEAGVLKLGIAYTKEDPALPHIWNRFQEPVLTPHDKDVRWWENSTMYKSSIIRDKENLTGHKFVMYYNARGDSINPARGAERIGMAVSEDMVTWKRFSTNPVINHHKGISGDPYIQKIDDVYVMFYFGAFWGKNKATAFNRFACSYDLQNWTDWNGEDLIHPSEEYDGLFAHKSFVVKYNGVVYHFYNAVNKKQDRGIALATSQDLGHSSISFSLHESEE
jgi:predicted GH43/DUF377 family glycosyl hydrolase